MNEQLVGEEMFKTMLDTIITSQEHLTTEVRDIKTSMIEVVRIEERLANQKETLARIGKILDNMDIKIDALEEEVTMVTVKHNSMAARITWIASGAATVITAVVAATIQYIFTH
jgi:hypothetical protein